MLSKSNYSMHFWRIRQEPRECHLPSCEQPPHTCSDRLVFDNYTWADDGSQYSDYNGKLIPSQIPYSVLIRGTNALTDLLASSQLIRLESRTFGR